MRIGIVCYPTVGGSGVIATEMAIALAGKGHEVHLLSYDRPNRLRRGVPGLRFHKVEVTAYPLFRFPPYDLALATRMLEVPEEAQVDLFHVHYAIPHAVSAFLARSMCGDCLKFATTLHGTNATIIGSDRAYMRPTRFALEHPERGHRGQPVPRRRDAADVRRAQGGRGDPNFVDVDRFRPDGSPRWHQRGDGERILVHASNFRPVKRVADVVRAFADPAARAGAPAAGRRRSRPRTRAGGGIRPRLRPQGRASGHARQHRSGVPQADLFLSASEKTFRPVDARGDELWGALRGSRRSVVWRRCSATPAT